ncbi:uncharacterized protein [Venturia canescens]|uniref:uncharacterized protein n=1 Tax=Venturia canescens TaxID=32260 RepID=UPI001C9D14CB|nr:uncharacterized protein LOC122414118 [Venturia canescens]
MGIVSSTFASLAIRFAWNCQRFLDPQYRYIEATDTKTTESKMVAVAGRTKMPAEGSDRSDKGGGAAFASAATPSTTRLTSLEHHQTASANCLPTENNNSLHQENRHRRATQHRYRKRPSSFDVSLIIRNKNKPYYTTTSGLVTTSTPSTLMRQPAPSWQSTSTSGSSADSSDDSEIEFMYASRTAAATTTAVGPSNERAEEKSTNVSRDASVNNEKSKNSTDTECVDPEGNPLREFVLTAAEEAAFRMTIGRGHFSRSKKDRFLNNLRLEKRLNGLNKEFFELACRAHTRSLRRRHSGDLRRIV